MSDPDDIERIREEAKQAGRREVVEWIKQYALHRGRMPLNIVIEDMKTHSSLF